jgi:HJR/Mrr/RecB family endonuclease
MPRIQSDAYDDAVREAAAAKEDGAMLRALHRWRSISLHPIHPEMEPDDTFIAMSARLSSTMSILDDIRKRGEKVLIFLESLEFQVTLKQLIQRRFRLPHAPLIVNGGISGQNRQKAVDDFQDKQSRTGFDVMILSPRAGGVGLTLTAANHVIHLSRWWNPAVEDQCTDRVYRIGQTREVHVYYPQAIHKQYGDKSFDVHLHNLLERKRQLSREMLLPPMGVSDTRTLFNDTLESGRGDSSPPFELGSIDEMEPLQFENWVMGRLRASGYRVSRTPRSHDGGADVVATHSQTGRRIIIQCKHTQRDESCGEQAINDLLRARIAYAAQADLLVAITNAKGFGSRAAERARSEGIVTIDRTGLYLWPSI